MLLALFVIDAPLSLHLQVDVAAGTIELVDDENSGGRLKYQ